MAVTCGESTFHFCQFRAVKFRGPNIVMFLSFYCPANMKCFYTLSYVSIAARQLKPKYVISPCGYTQFFVSSLWLTCNSE